MSQEMYKHDALLHLVWTVATTSKTEGNDTYVTPEEDDYLNTVRKTEGISIDWDDFNAKRKQLGYSHETIIDEACKALRGCGKEWRIKCLGYMMRMSWVSEDGDPENNCSDNEWGLIMRAQRELGLSDEERSGSYNSLPRK